MEIPMTRNPKPGLKHDVWSVNGFVCISNNEDDHYTQFFNNRKEIEDFIAELRQEMDEVWPEGVNPEELQEEEYQKIQQKQKEAEKKQEEYRRNNPPTSEEIEEQKRKTDHLINLMERLSDDTYISIICSKVAENHCL